MRLLMMFMVRETSDDDTHRAEKPCFANQPSVGRTKAMTDYLCPFSGSRDNNMMTAEEEDLAGKRRRPE